MSDKRKTGFCKIISIPFLNMIIVMRIYLSILAFASLFFQITPLHAEHIRSDGMGGYYTPNGHIRSDGMGGYYTPNGHIRSDGMGGYYMP